MVIPVGFEPTAFNLRGCCSNRTELRDHILQFYFCFFESYLFLLGPTIIDAKATIATKRVNFLLTRKFGVCLRTILAACIVIVNSFSGAGTQNRTGFATLRKWLGPKVLPSGIFMYFPGGSPFPE